MRHDRERTLVVDRIHSVLDGHSALQGLVEEPAHDVGLRGPGCGDLLAGDDGDAGSFTALPGLVDRGHRVMVGDRDEVEVGFDRGVDQLGGRDHAVGGEGVAVGVG